jgi:hypothetical protein
MTGQKESKARQSAIERMLRAEGIDEHFVATIPPMRIADIASSKA